MTSATSSSKSSGLGMFFSGRLFTDNNKRSWPVMLLLFLLIFFSCPVVMLLALNHSERTTSIDSIANELLSQPLLILMYVYAVVFALISVGVVMGYMHSKRSGYFYGSLPIKRGALFATQYVTGVIFFAVPFLVNVLLTLGVVGMFGAMSTLTSTVVWHWILNTLAVYMVVYSFAVLASNLSGMKSTSLMVMLLLFFYLPALYYTVLGYVSVLYRYINADYLMSSMDTLKLSPVINTFIILKDPTTLSGVITLLLYIIVPTLIALWLNHKLNYEIAENAISFKSFQSVLKYAVIFPCAIMGALLFYALGELEGRSGLYYEMTPSGAAWLIFGAISGGLLSYMIINVILNKNFKALFDKFRNFGIFAAIFAVLFTLFTVDPMGIDRYVPAESSVSGVWFEDNYGYFFNRDTTRKIEYSSSLSDNTNKRLITDKELIAQINRISKIAIEYGESGDWKDENSDIWSSDMINFRPVYKLGPISLAKKMSIPYDLIKDELEKLTTNPQFVQYYYYPMLEDNLEDIFRESVGGSKFTLNTDTPAMEIYKYSDEYQQNKNYDLTLNEVINLLKVIASDLKNGVIFSSKSPSIMGLSINNYNSEYGGRNNFYLSIEITKEFTNTIAYLREKGIITNSDYSQPAELVQALILNMPEGQLTVTDKEVIKQILENLVFNTDSDEKISVSARMDNESGDIQIGYITRNLLPQELLNKA